MSTKWVVEVSSNHNNDLYRCLKFAMVAYAIGADAVKFQLFKIDELFAPEILKRSKMHCDRRKWELPVSFLPEIAAACQQYDVQFSCTPFYLKAVDELYPHVDFYKIASYELLWGDLLLECAKTGKPMVLSTGMATLDEIDRAVDIIRMGGCTDLTLLHCTSAYPTPAEQCNLAAIQTMRSRYQCAVGWSDHSVSQAVLYRAVNHWYASMVEFHLDLDEQGAEFSIGHCWTPGPISRVIANCKAGLLADGDGVKAPVEAELPDREWRADPEDGLRPFKHIRETFRGDDVS